MGEAVVTAAHQYGTRRATDWRADAGRRSDRNHKLSVGINLVQLVLLAGIQFVYWEANKALRCLVW